ncbi:MAG TPA: hypothetical protein VFO69_02760 [Allosphingosinicella sp.]|nr:hypothetical protein [Allosphingosinicella sp.]
MMTDPATFVALASAGTAAIGIATAAVLRGWQEYLDLRRTQVGNRGPRSRAPAELIELRARVRRLEAIASGAER